MEKISALLFILGYGSLALGMFFVKKTDKQQNALAWIPITIVLIMSYHALMGGIINMCGIPVDLMTLGLADLVPGVLLCLAVFKYRQVQKLKWYKRDFLIGMVVLVAVVYAAYKQFGVYFTPYYRTEPDPASHMRFAIEIMQSHKLGNMYYAALNNSLLMSVFRALLPAVKLYHVFVLSDILMLGIAGLTFYALIEHYIKTKIQVFLGVVFTVAYVLGYPRNNMVIGFVYLGMGVTLCGVLIFLLRSFYEDKENHFMYLCGLFLGVTGIGVCYTMFAVPMYISIALVLSIYIWREKQITKSARFKKIFIWNVAMFAIPCIITLRYSMFQVASVKQMTTSITGGLSVEGYCYAEPFWDVVWLLPFIVWGIYKAVKMREELVLATVLGIDVGYVLLLLIRMAQGNLSLYYFIKNYYVLALLLFVLGFYGATKMITYRMVPIILLASELIITVGGRNHGIKLDSVYRYNEENMNYSDLSIDAIQLFQDYDRNAYGDQKIIFRGIRSDYYWFRAISEITSEENVIWWPWYEKGYVAPGDTVVVLNYESAQADEWLKKIGFENVDVLYKGDAGYVVRMKVGSKAAF